MLLQNYVYFLTIQYKSSANKWKASKKLLTTNKFNNVFFPLSYRKITNNEVKQIKLQFIGLLSFISFITVSLF